jgi:hypothetical protein
MLRHNIPPFSEYTCFLLYARFLAESSGQRHLLLIKENKKNCNHNEPLVRAHGEHGGVQEKREKNSRISPFSLYMTARFSWAKKMNLPPQGSPALGFLGIRPHCE